MKDIESVAIEFVVQTQFWISFRVLMRSTLPNISESGTPSGLRGNLNELVYGKVSIFENGEANHLESNESRNIHFDLTSDDEFSAILSRNGFRDDPEEVG